MERICIIGAGPSGLGCALSLASRGIASTILEKESFPREKICGDGLSGRSVEALNRIDPAIVKKIEQHPGAQPSFGVRFVSPGGKTVLLDYSDGEMKSPSGFVMRRKDFDALMAEHAGENRLIDLQEDYNVDKIMRNGTSWLIQSGNGRESMLCDLLVIATGNKSSRLLRMVDAGQESSPAKPGAAIRTYYEGVSGIGETFPIEIHFYRELLPWYLWIFPLPGGIVNTGLGVLYESLHKHDQSLKELFHQFIHSKKTLRERFSGARQIESVKADQIDYYQGRRKLAGDGYIILGDAAQLIDPFTGEGIGNALFSGIRAADTIARFTGDGDLSRKNTAAYEEAIYRTMQDELELGLKLQNRANQAWLISLVVNKTLKSKSAREGLMKMIYNMNNMKDLNNPLYYLKVLLNL
jgi:geranylgeranyl reductase family protein